MSEKLPLDDLQSVVRDQPLESDQPTAAAFEGVQQALGHRFHSPDLLLRALTHPSYVTEHP